MFPLRVLKNITHPSPILKNKILASIKGSKILFGRTFSTSDFLRVRPFYEEKDIENVALSKMKEVRPDHDISIHSRFYDDLEMNDFDRMDFILALEVHFGVTISDNEAIDAERIRDVTWYLFRRLMVLSAGMATGGILDEPDERVIALNEHEPHDH
ncbi:hypothetical protein RF11_10070 [Thelohanellus kitauei]|uniref:Carrier domain-containing protein n=1 Tax=Thelohanellus kitauei TaxID=669202 RepID=A0A0C2N8K7_THEKT|nr:hypothetical protein RF11_10070 [Thelohanellus kitauei]